jgi:hypothetical protein
MEGAIEIWPKEEKTEIDHPEFWKRMMTDQEERKKIKAKP